MKRVNTFLRSGAGQSTLAWLIILALTGVMVYVSYLIDPYLQPAQDYLEKLGGPTPIPLECTTVRIPPQARLADLCTMPDGQRCVFSRHGQPTVCYPPEVETK